MSSIVKFFAGAETDAAQALDAGPGAHLRVLSYGNLDVEEALLDWESRLTGRPFESLADEGLPRTVAEVDDGAVVLALSEVLQDALGALTPAEVDELARWWVAEDSGDGIDLEIAVKILTAVAELVREQREGVYCWAT